MEALVLSPAVPALKKGKNLLSVLYAVHDKLGDMAGIERLMD
jgi:hypothetical protein